MAKQKTPKTNLPKGLSLDRGSLRISFHYNGRLYRKGTGLKPTKQNISFLEAQLNQMRAEKALGKINILEHFPNKSNQEETKLKGTVLSILVKEYCDRKLKLGRWSLSTYDRRIVTLNTHFNPAFGNLLITELTPSLIRNWLSKQTFSSAYASQVLGLMNPIISAAVGDGVIPRHPYKHINPSEYLKTSTTSQRKQIINPLSLSEIDKLLLSCDERERNFWTVGIFTGLRLQELIALRWEDIDFNNATLHIQRAVKRRHSNEEYIGVTKNEGSNRIIEADKLVMEALKNHRKFTQLEGGFVFKPQSPKQLQKERILKQHAQGLRTRVWGLRPERERYSFNHIKVMWRNLLVQAGISPENRSPKQIRHTYASLMLSAGKSPIAVSTSMGHSSLTMIEKHYAKWIAVGSKKRRDINLEELRQEELRASS